MVILTPRLRALLTARFTTKSVGKVVNRTRMHSLFGVFVAGLISSVGSFPSPEETSGSVDTSFIGKGTSEFATALLQGFVQKEENMVYSPFGYSAILAVFSEGARGVSREELATALHFPSDVSVVRQAYQSVLERFSGLKSQNSPEFRNWFYIYKNYTVDEELQNVLRKYYLTNVKCVNRPEEYISAPKPPTSGSTNTEEKTATPVKEEQSTTETADKAKIEQPVEANVQKLESVKVEENSATPPEAPKTLEKNVVPGEGENAKVENSKYKGEEDIARSETVVKDETEKKTSEEKTKKEDVATADVKSDAEVPAEHFSGNTDSSLSVKGPDSTPRMVIFNGLYYKGKWETPFAKRQADDSRPFYKSDTEKVFVKTIHSQGVFNYGSISNLDCRAIELPYEGGRYSLLVLVPNTRNGLSKLISDLSGYPFKSIYDQLSEKLVEVCLPTFEINTISKPVSSLNRLVMKKVPSIFNPDTADLSGITSKDAGLYVDELVQVVTFKVDAEYSKANFLTASIASSRSNVHNFQINQPFLFYLRDNLDDIIVVNGKVIDPTPKPNFYFS